MKLWLGARSSGGDAAAPGLPGTPRDFRRFYDLWFEAVAVWIRALGGPEADRDDIVQEVFLVVRRRLEDFDGVNPAGWLYRITQRQVRDFRRRTWVKHIFNRRRVDRLDALPHGGGTPAAALERKEDERVLQTILGKIREERRLTFVLFEIEGLSGEEIARIQDVPLNTVWTRLHQARKDFVALAARYRVWASVLAGVLFGCGALASAALGPWRGSLERTYEAVIRQPATTAPPRPSAAPPIGPPATPAPDPTAETLVLDGMRALRVDGDPPRARGLRGRSSGR